jgi:hypothetical protein
MATVTISVIKLDATQKTWVQNQNCICSSVLTEAGYEAWATYFSGATVTNINVDEI